MHACMHTHAHSLTHTHTNIHTHMHTLMFTHTIWAYFVCLNFQHTKIWKCKNKYISRDVLQVFCCPAWNMPRSGFSVAHVSVLQPLAAIVSVFVLCFVYFLAISKQGLIVFQLESTSIHHFSGSHVEIIFRLFSLRTKWNGKEVMEKVPKQWGNKCSCQDANMSPAWNMPRSGFSVLVSQPLAAKVSKQWRNKCSCQDANLSPA